MTHTSKFLIGPALCPGNAAKHALKFTLHSSSALLARALNAMPWAREMPVGCYPTTKSPMQISEDTRILAAKMGRVQQ
jgi:hypothetical protein